MASDTYRELCSAAVENFTTEALNIFGMARTHEPVETGLMPTSKFGTTQADIKLLGQFATVAGKPPASVIVFGREDLPLVIKVIDQAHNWIYQQAGSASDSGE